MQSNRRADQHAAANFTIRIAAIEDSETIIAHRRAMFSEMGYRNEQALELMSAEFRSWLQRKMAEQEYLAWFAVSADDSVAAGVGLWLMDWPPNMIAPGARRAHFLNVYTDPGSRRMGLARRLMQTALDWCRANGMRAAILHSSEEGRVLYQSLGFQPTNEMRLLL